MTEKSPINVFEERCKNMVPKSTTMWILTNIIKSDSSAASILGQLLGRIFKAISDVFKNILTYIIYLEIGYRLSKNEAKKAAVVSALSMEGPVQRTIRTSSFSMS